MYVVYKRNEEIISFCKEDEAVGRGIFWQYKCYSSYTSKHNLDVMNTWRENEAQEPTAENIVNRFLCIFCKTKKRKGKTVLHVATTETISTTRRAAQIKGDNYILHVTSDSVIAAKAKYHKSCCVTYVTKSHIERILTKESSKA